MPYCRSRRDQGCAISTVSTSTQPYVVGYGAPALWTGRSTGHERMACTALNSGLISVSHAPMPSLHSVASSLTAVSETWTTARCHTRSTFLRSIYSLLRRAVVSLRTPSAWRAICLTYCARHARPDNAATRRHGSSQQHET